MHFLALECYNLLLADHPSVAIHQQIVLRLKLPLQATRRKILRLISSYPLRLRIWSSYDFRRYTESSLPSLATLYRNVRSPWGRLCMITVIIFHFVSLNCYHPIFSPFLGRAAPCSMPNKLGGCYVGLLQGGLGGGQDSGKRRICSPGSELHQRFGDGPHRYYNLSPKDVST